MKLAKLNYATLMQGLNAGLLNTYALFEVNKISLLYASIWSSVYVMGLISGSFIKNIKPLNLKVYAQLLRVAMLVVIVIFTSGENQVISLVILGYLLAMASRKQFIDLKHLVAFIDKNKLTKHGAYNALGYGSGSLIAGITFLQFESIYLILTALTLLLSFWSYPNVVSDKSEEHRGLSKRDIYIAIIFVIGSTPLNNTLGLLIITELNGEKFAGLAAFAFTLGSLLSGRMRNFIMGRWRPIGSSLATASLLFLIALILDNQPLTLATRFLIGSLLFASQGLLEERAKSDKGLSQGIEFLWNIFSLTAFISMLILPIVGKEFGFFMLGLLSLICSIIIMSLKLIIRTKE